MIDINMEEARQAAKYAGGYYEHLMNQILDRLEVAEQERDELRAKITEMERQEPIGTLHDDGCFVWRETAPHQSNYAGWKMALYALPGAKGEDK